jgi:hypothetical protein
MSYESFSSTAYLDGTFGAAKDFPLTLVCWIKISAAQWSTAELAYAYCISDNTADHDNLVNIAQGWSDRVNAYTRDNAGGTSAATHDFTPGDYDDIWVPIIGTFATSNTRTAFIKDSTSSTTNNSAETVDASFAVEIRVGRLMGATIDQFKGQIAEIAIFDKVLSAGEIDSLQSSSQTGPAPNTVAPSNCIGYWPLNTDQATHADQSGNGGPSLSEQGTVAFNSDHPTITGETLMGAGIF